MWRRDTFAVYAYHGTGLFLSTCTIYEEVTRTVLYCNKYKGGNMVLQSSYPLVVYALQFKFLLFC